MTYRGRRRARWGEPVLLAAAVLLALAGLVLLVDRPLGMRFSGFLLAALAAALVLGLYLSRWARVERRGWWCWLAFRAALVLVLVPLGIVEINVIQEGMTGDLSAARADAVVVLGAGVNGTEPSLSLRTRLDAALQYLEDNPDIPAVLTGGQGYGEEITEARCMYDYLTAHGVDGSRLILEEQAANTAENFAFSKALLEERGIDPAEALVAVVTNDFHIARSKLIAARQGYGYAFGVPAELPWVHLSVNYYLREAFAMVKTFFFD
ncbi:MAG: YdcF family protein [Oscillospiraceae bacterium]|nr:YdcF family protein [Oscillospiraceae bacterium]